MRDTSEIGLERQNGHLVITVPRLPSRPTLQMCRGRAKVIAARQHHIRTEPDVISYEGLPIPGNGPLSNPQGWIFTFAIAGQESGPPKGP